MLLMALVARIKQQIYFLICGASHDLFMTDSERAIMTS